MCWLLSLRAGCVNKRSTRNDVTEKARWSHAVTMKPIKSDGLPPTPSYANHSPRTRVPYVLDSCLSQRIKYLSNFGLLFAMRWSPGRYNTIIRPRNLVLSKFLLNCSLVVWSLVHRHYSSLTRWKKFQSSLSKQVSVQYNT